MVRQSYWDILGIERTKDKLKIKKAYTKLAHKTSPEEDPEGFKRIHSAYKQAMNYASGMGFRVSILSDSGITDESINSSPADKPIPKKESKTEFDFSTVIAEEEEFSEEIERILEAIVTLKTNNAVDTVQNVARWNQSTLTKHANNMFYLYSVLYTKTEDLSIWNVFFEEPLIKHMIYDLNFRYHMRSRFPEESEAGKIIEDYCNRFENKVKQIENKYSEKAEYDAAKHQREVRAAVWLIVSIVCFIAMVVVVVLLAEDKTKIGILLGIEFILGELLTISVFYFRWYGNGWGYEMTRTVQLEIFLRNILIVLLNAVFLIVSAVFIIESDLANRYVMAACMCLGISCAVAMCMQYRKKGKK